jgi:IclR family acetate operon transcriptional repressor
LALLDRALDALEYVAEQGNVRVGQLCDDLKLPRPTAHRLLTVLVARGYLAHDAAAHVYEPGPAMMSMATNAASGSVVHHGAPALVRLRDATGETANLAVLRGGRMVYGATVDGTVFPRMSVIVGQDVPAHAAAVGKAILAHLGDDERTRLVGPEPYKRYTEYTKQTREELDADLAEIAKRGYAVDNEEVDVDAVCIASVIFNQREEPIGAVSLSATTSRFPQDRWDQLGALVMECGSQLSKALQPSSSGRKR